jgi:predicted kinase
MRIALIGNSGSGKSTWVREYYSRAGDLSLAAHQALFDEYRGVKHKLTARSDAAALGGLLS